MTITSMYGISHASPRPDEPASTVPSLQALSDFPSSRQSCLWWLRFLDHVAPEMAKPSCKAFTLTLSVVARHQRLALKAEAGAAVGAAAAAGCSASEIDLAGAPASTGRNPSLQQKRWRGPAHLSFPTERSLGKNLSVATPVKPPEQQKSKASGNLVESWAFCYLAFSWPRWRRSSAP